MTEIEQNLGSSEICLMDAGYYFWSIVADTEELTDILSTLSEGEPLGIIDAYLEIFDPKLPPLVTDRSEEEERKVWTIKIPGVVKMAIESVVAKTILTEETNLTYETPKDKIL